ncbi:TetR/AcrR family transcriptional regulator [Streptomyces brasiliensis]|uniref:TetR family transcriptional regulator n=1 Tax=Streptomyces brasiliensis TaxID=1954 RepID=A0A917NKP6_9ACTN|nr:TetR/AcrR family transcriptional regulator [Streptomyces brasiliensis]GGJ08017.1 TetR family transcriptional regulator [Streptomyces brasiliensis]
MTVRSAQGRRRPDTPRKGDVREQAILDTAEALLGEVGFEAMTVADIAEGAGISRGSLYFYFRSKHDVVSGLVARTVTALQQKSQDAAHDPAEPREAIATVMSRTRALWQEHGVVMRVATDLNRSVPEVEALWSQTAEVFIEAITRILHRVGVPEGDGPHDARSLAGALCWMIERTFYHASRAGDDELERAAVTCLEIWLRTARLV